MSCRAGWSASSGAGIAQIVRSETVSDRISGLALKAGEVSVEAEGSPVQYFARLSFSFLPQGRYLLVDDTPLRPSGSSPRRVDLSLRVRLVGKVTPVRVIAIATEGQLKEEKLVVRYNGWPTPPDPPIQVSAAHARKTASEPSPPEDAPTSPASAGSPGSEASPYRQNRLMNLHYYVPARHLQPSLSVSPYLDYSTHTSSDGTPTSSSSRSETSTGLTVAYGIIDRLRINGSIGYLTDETVNSTNSTTGQLTTTHARGFSNPTFRLAYRPLNDESSGLYGDVALSFSPSLGTRLAATTGQTGNFLNGQSIEELEVSLYWAVGIHELGLSLFTFYYGSGTSQSDTSTNTYTFDGLNTFTGSLRYRLHLTQGLFLQPAFNFIFAYTSPFTYPNRNPALTVTNQFPFRLTPTFQMGYVFGDEILLDTSLAYSKYTVPSTETQHTQTFAGQTETLILTVQISVLL